MADEQGPTFDFGFDGDEAQARTEAERMARVLEDAFVSAFARIGPQLAKQLSKGFKNANGPKQVFDDAQESAARFAAAAAKHSARLQADFLALNNRIEATRDTLNKAGVDPRLFAVFDQAVQTSLSNLRELDRELEQGDGTPDKFKQIEASAQASLRLAQKEVAGIQSELKAVTVIQGKALEAQRSQAQQAATARQRADDHAHGKFIAAYQREGAETLTANRIAGQRIIQNERQTQRVRVETMRFAFTQIRALERGVSSVLGGSARLASSAIGGVSAVTSRMAGLLRRNNRDLNDGLRPALLSREQSLSRSFSRQSTTVNNSLRQQSVALERFERQSSTGVVGALTGRSRVGTALGLGAGIGGGFALFQGLKNGLKIGGDFVQGLAVLEAQLGLTAEQMQSVRAQSIELGNDISLPGVSALDAAQAIQILAKQFASLGTAALPNAQAAARGVLQLARATGASAEEAGRVVGAAVNVFGIEASKAVQVADQVTNALTNAAGVGFSDFADAFQQSAAVFAQFQVPAVGAEAAMTELNTSLAILARSGNVGSDAGTSLKQFFLSTVRGSKPAVKALREVTERAGEVGTVFFDEAGKTRPLTEALDILRRGLKGLSDQARNETLNKIFGSDAIRTANALLNVSTEEFNRLTEAMRQTGSAAEIAKAQNTGLRGSLDALKSVIETQQIKTYEKYQGVIGKVVLQFANLLNAFFEGRGVFGVIRGALEGIAVTLGGLLIAKTAVEGVKLLTLALGGLVTPLGLVVGGLALIGAAIGGLAAASPEFRDELGQIGDQLKDRLADGASAIGDNLARLVRFIRSKVVPAFVEFGIALLRRVIPIIESTIGTVQELFSILVRGDFTGRGPWTEDSPVVAALFRFRQIVTDVIGAVSEIWSIFVHRDFTGRGPWEEDSPVVAALFRFRDLVAAGVGAVEEIWSIFIRRDFTGKGPWEEDSPIVNALFKFRDTVAGVFNSIDDLIFGAFENINTARIVSTIGAAALGGAIGGPIGAALAAGVTFGLGSIGFAKIGRQLISAITPQLVAFAAFINDFLSGPGIHAAGRVGGAVIGFLVGPFQQAVQSLGFLIGNLSTDPRFVHALEQLVGLALLTGVNFVEGLGRGIADNLPALATLFGGQLKSLFQTAFEKAFDPRAIARFLVSGLGAALIGAALIRSLSRPTDAAGRKVGQGFVRSFASAVKTTSVTAVSGTPFSQGFFGGFEKSAQRSAQRATKAVETEFGRLNRNLNRLGQVGVLRSGFAGGKGIISDEDLRLARERMGQIEQTVGRGATAGALLRQQLGDVGRSIGGVFRGIGTTWAGDISNGTTLVKSSLGKLRTSVGDSFRNIQQNLRATGVSIGQVIGGAILAGVSSALAGQQLGQASSTGGKALGLAGVIASALFAGAAVGGGPQGAIVGGAVLGVGLLTAAFQKNDDAAKEAEASVQRYVDVIEQFSTVKLAVPDLSAALADQLLDLGPAARRVLEQSGFNIGDFISDVTEGQGSLAGAIRGLTGGLDVDQRRVQDFIDSELRLGDTGKEAIANLNKAFAGNKTTNQAQALALELRNAGVDGKAFLDILTLLFDQGGALGAAPGLADLRDDLLATADDGKTATEQMDRFRDSVLDGARAVNSGGLSPAFLANAASDSEIAKAKIDAVGQAVDSLNEKRTNNINTQIGEVTTQLTAARDAAKQALDNILALVGGDLFDDFQQQLDQGILGAADVGQALADALKGTPATEGTPGIPGIDIAELFKTGVDSTTGSAKLHAILDPFVKQVQGIIAAGFTNGLTLPEIGDQLAPVSATIQGLDIPQSAKDAMLDIINGFLHNEAVVAEVDRMNIANQAATDLQNQLDDLQLSLPVKIEFNPAQIQAELKALQDLGLFTGSLPTLGEIAAAQQAARNAEPVPVVSTADSAARAGEGGFTVEEINIYEANSATVTASETTAALRAAAASGRLRFAVSGAR